MVVPTAAICFEWLVSNNVVKDEMRAGKVKLRDHPLVKITLSVVIITLHFAPVYHGAICLPLMPIAHHPTRRLQKQTAMGLHMTVPKLLFPLLKKSFPFIAFYFRYIILDGCSFSFLQISSTSLVSTTKKSSSPCIKMSFLLSA